MFWNISKSFQNKVILEKVVPYLCILLARSVQGGLIPWFTTSLCQCNVGNRENGYATHHWSGTTKNVHTLKGVFFSLVEKNNIFNFEKGLIRRYALHISATRIAMNSSASLTLFIWALLYLTLTWLKKLLNFYIAWFT